MAVGFEPLGREHESVETQDLDRPQTSYWQDAWRRLKQNKAAIASLIIILLIVLAAVFGPLLSPFSYSKQSLIFQNTPPSLVWY
jgi:ABC-type antimicrobial peptide transport system permease subunit